MKEIELREKELEMKDMELQLKLKKMELEKSIPVSSSEPPPTSASSFDVSHQVKLGPTTSLTRSDKFLV